MRGELYPVWSETWRDIWSPLGELVDVPDDLFAQLYRELAIPPSPPDSPMSSQATYDQNGRLISVEDIDALAAYKSALVSYHGRRARYNEAITGVNSGEALQKLLVELVDEEDDALETLGRSYGMLESTDDESLRNNFFLLVEKFLEKFSLRYELRRPFTFHPTPSGVFAKLSAEIASQCATDSSLSGLLRDYREAFQDLRFGATPGRINTCLQKQVNLLEGVASRNPRVTAKTLGRMCNQIKSWPSDLVLEAAKSLYWFASDHTGIRHGTVKSSDAGKKQTPYRDMEMRDLIAVSAFFTGVTAYLSDELDPQKIYGGKG